MKKLILWIICLFISGFNYAQSIQGQVLDEDKKSLSSANLYWAETTIGTVTNELGEFSISNPPKYPAKLVASFTGFKNDTVEVNNSNQNKITFRLEALIELEEFEIIEEKAASQTAITTLIHTESLNRGELEKAACCNLSESFSTNASVDVINSDAVTGAKQIRMLGLDGVYSQLLFENLPMMRGLSYGYQMSAVPGTWVESIQINKGTGSVVNGFESLTGQINLEYVKPDDEDLLFVNLYANNLSRLETNVQSSFKVNDRWSSNILVHANNISGENDNNSDGFIDLPMGNQTQVFNRWKYKNCNQQGQIGFKWMNNTANSGQTSFYDNLNPYGINREINHAEVFAKRGFIFKEKRWKSIGTMASTHTYERVMNFGNHNYRGEQSGVYFNSIFQSELFREQTFRAGLSFVYDNFQENFNDSLFSRQEFVPGAYFEQTLQPSEQFTAVLGIRGDHHNLFGFKASPRMHLKYHLKPLTIVRFSAGRGFRTPNALVENLSPLVSSRTLRSNFELQPEIANNIGLVFTHKFEVNERTWTFSTDYFQTHFDQQLIADVDHPDYLDIYALNGTSYAKTLQIDLSMDISDNLDIKLTYRNDDVKVDYQNGLRTKPMIPRNRGLIDLSIKTNDKKWQFNTAVNFFGQSRLPVTTQNATDFQLASETNSYYSISGQITKKFNVFDLYLGGENLNDFVQQNAILDASNPFGPNFDTSMVWGGVVGRVIYAGLRYSVKHKRK